MRSFTLRIQGQPLNTLTTCRWPPTGGWWCILTFGLWKQCIFYAFWYINVVAVLFVSMVSKTKWLLTIAWTSFEVWFDETKYLKEIHSLSYLTTEYIMVFGIVDHEGYCPPLCSAWENLPWSCYNFTCTL